MNVSVIGKQDLSWINSHYLCLYGGIDKRSRPLVFKTLLCGLFRDKIINRLQYQIISFNGETLAGYCTQEKEREGHVTPYRLIQVFQNSSNPTRNLGI